MREFDDVLGGMHPVAANKRPGKKKKEKKKDKGASGGKGTPKTAAGRKAGSKALAAQPGADLFAAEAAPAAVPAEAAPAPDAAPEAVAHEDKPKAVRSARPAMTDVQGEIQRLRAELQEQREARAALETRLRDAETRLRQAESHRVSASAPAPPATAPKPGLQDLGIFAPPAPPGKSSPAEFTALETWFMEAELRTSAAAGALAKPAGAQVSPALLQDLSDSELAARLASTRLAVEAAEARAAYNARQVKKLTEELAEARAAQIRSEARIRALEGRVQQTQARAGLLGKYVEERISEPAQEPLPWELDSLKPFAAPEPEPQAADATQEPEIQEGPAVEAAAARAENLGLELGPPLEQEPIKEPETPAAVADVTPDDLAAVLESWGREGPEPAPVPGGEPPAPSLDAATESEAEPQPDVMREEPSGPAPDLKTAAEAEPAASEPLLADVLAGWGQDVSEAELSVMEPERETAPESGLEPEFTRARAPEPSPEAEPVSGGEAAPAPEQVAEPQRKDGSGSMAEALGIWGGMQAEPAREEPPGRETPPPREVGKKSGKDAMVDALLRFMGPGS
ncbi:MAG: hypothetical protein KA184_08750 [Candidatus Hydrogenedentes bacterium]|nr:hypothetical protein [Candidatus Hydrogenedentota bacterium]